MVPRCATYLSTLKQNYEALHYRCTAGHMLQEAPKEDLVTAYRVVTGSLSLKMHMVSEKESEAKS